MNKDFMQKTNVKETKQGGNAGSIQIFEEKKLFQNILVPKSFCVQQIFGYKMFCFQKISCVKNILCPKNNFFPKNIGPKI